MAAGLEISGLQSCGRADAGAPAGSRRGGGGAELGTVACSATSPQSGTEGICATKTAEGAQYAQCRREQGRAAGWSPGCSHCTRAARLAPLRILGRRKRLQLSPLLY